MDATMARLEQEGATTFAPTQFLTTLRHCASDMNDRDVAQVLCDYDRHVQAALPLLGPDFLVSLRSYEFQSTVTDFLDSLDQPPQLRVLDKLAPATRAGDMPIRERGIEFVPSFRARIDNDFKDAEALLKQLRTTPGLAIVDVKYLLETTDNRCLDLLRPHEGAARVSLARSRLASLAPELHAVREHLPELARPTLACLHYAMRPYGLFLEIACKVSGITTGGGAQSLLAAIGGDPGMPNGLKNVLVLMVAKKIRELDGDDLRIGFRAITDICRHLTSDAHSDAALASELSAVLQVITEKFFRQAPAALLQVPGAQESLGLLQQIQGTRRSHMSPHQRNEILASAARTALVLPVAELDHGLSRLSDVYRSLSFTGTTIYADFLFILTQLDRLPAGEQEVRAGIQAFDAPAEVKDVLSRVVDRNVERREDRDMTPRPAR
jgi:hypothetical protein